MKRRPSAAEATPFSSVSQRKRRCDSRQSGWRWRWRWPAQRHLRWVLVLVVLVLVVVSDRPTPTTRQSAVAWFVLRSRVVPCPASACGDGRAAAACGFLHRAACTRCACRGGVEHEAQQPDDQHNRGYIVSEMPVPFYWRNRCGPECRLNRWCRLRGLNSRPSVYKTAALPLS
jgi:hypothetical protein